MWRTTKQWRPPPIHLLWLVLVVVVVLLTPVDGMSFRVQALWLDAKKFFFFFFDSPIASPCPSAETDNSHLSLIHPPSQT